MCHFGYFHWHDGCYFCTALPESNKGSVTTVGNSVHSQVIQAQKEKNLIERLFELKLHPCNFLGTGWGGSVCLSSSFSWGFHFGDKRWTHRSHVSPVPTALPGCRRLLGAGCAAGSDTQVLNAASAQPLAEVWLWRGGNRLKKEGINALLRIFSSPSARWVLRCSGNV